MQQARNIVQASLAPAPDAVIVKALAELSMLTKARDGGAEAEETRIALYAQKLAEYPADAVVAVCREWANKETFWPSWAELYARLEARIEPRRMMLEALQ